MSETAIRYEHGYHAMQCAFDGISSKQLALAMLESGLWDLKLDSARARARSCMNPDGDQYFKNSDLLFLQWRFQRFDVLYYWCDVLEHARPARIVPALNQAQAKARLLELEREREALQAQIAMGDEYRVVPRFAVRKEDING